MRIDWAPLDAALEARSPVLWWRDDDGVAPSAALERLLASTAKVGAPLMLASISRDATEALAMRLQGEPSVTVAPHGWGHTNHAPATEKKAEFGAHRPLATIASEAAQAKARIDALFGPQAVPVFVPPWNRISENVAGALRGAGYSALSTYGLRGIGTEALPRLDAHIDPVDWRGTRSAIDPDTLIAHVAALIEDGHPIGLMTHHLMHDDAIWTLTDALARRLTERGGKWVDIRDLLNDL